MRALSILALAAAAVLAPACSGAPDDADGTDEARVDLPSRIVLQMDPAMPAAARARIEQHLRDGAGGAAVVVAPPDQVTFASGDHVLALGDTAAARALVPTSETSSLSDAGYVLRSAKKNGARVLAARANGTRGLLYGSYAALEQVGFAFLHPLSPVTPAHAAIPSAAIDRRETPYWRVRGMHLHTMHPLELTNVLNGWGQGGPNDAASFRSMLADWDHFLEWMVANGQNRVEWVILEAKSWETFSTSSERQQRLAEVVRHAHDWSLEAGADAPISLQQQHTFRLVKDPSGDLAPQLASIRERVGFLMGAGFDFLSTENGTSEFTHSDPQRMLAWMNEVVRTMNDDHGGRRATIKIHASTGQTADGFVDPIDGGPLNVNMLPHYADKRLGIMPHTVEHYGLDDPAPTYGNDGFSSMRKFLVHEMGTREVVWHPETAYWVSFDIDVPLFLPLYADRRVHDLRLLAGDEARVKKKMDGQVVFSSGWEWGYWLNDVVAARAAWNPHADAATDTDAMDAILHDALPGADALVPVLESWMKDERDLLILGSVGGALPKDVRLRNGQAYLQGWETWDDVSLLAGKIPGVPAPKTQPDHLGLVEMRNPLHGGVGYSKEIEPLLAAMERTFGARTGELAAAAALVPAGGMRDLADELVDTARMTTLRAKEVHALYDYVDKSWEGLNPFSNVRTWRAGRLAAAKAAVDEAATIVKSREAHYRVPVARIAAWGNNPTAYEFGYLWTVHSLFFWRRDVGKATTAPLSPCYLNIINPVDVAMGEGWGTDAARLARDVFQYTPGLGSVTECLAEPSREPTF